MADIDNLIARMAARNIERAVVIGDQQMKLYGANGETTGPVMPAARVHAMVEEIVPAALRPALTRTRKYELQHASPSGVYSVEIERSSSAVQIAITPSLGNVSLLDEAPEPEYVSDEDRVKGALIFVGAFALAGFSVYFTHSTKRVYPVLVIGCPVVAFMGLYVAMTGERIPWNFDLMALRHKLVVGLGFLAGLVLCGLIEAGAI